MVLIFQHIKGSFAPYFVVFSLLFCQVVAGQVAKIDFAKVSQAYTNTKTYQLNFTVTTTEQDSKKASKSEGLILKDGDNMYGKFEDSEFVYNNKSDIFVDNKDKIIYIYQLKALSKSKKKSSGLADVDSIYNKADTVIFNGNKEGCLKYTLFFKEGPIVKTEISIDSKSYFIKKISYYYQKNTKDILYVYDKMIIDYEVLNGKTNKKYFLVSEYMTVKNGKLSLNARFKGYEIKYDFDDL